MTFFKYICFLLLSVVTFTAHAQQNSLLYNVEWLGFNATQQLLDGSYVSYPMAKNAFINEDGILVLQKDIPGKIIGAITQESIQYYAGDSSSKSALNKLTLDSEASITYIHLYNDYVSTRVYIPLLKISGNGTWTQISSITIRYATTTVIDDTPIQTNTPYTTNPYSMARTTSASGSVLANGEWYKMSVTQDGIYKLDVSFLSSMGINTSTIDPTSIQVYGNGGGMLPQPNSSPRLDDIVENAIYLSEDGNGIFDNNDYILFYGATPNPWSYNAITNVYTHEYNLYSNQNYYYLTFGQQTAKQISNQASVTGTLQTVTNFDEHAYSENDIYNIIDSGREWYGFQFSTYNRNLSTPFNVTGLVPNSQLRLATAIMGRSYVSTQMAYQINGTNIGTQNIPALSTATHAPLGVNASTSYNFDASVVGGNSNLNVEMTFTNGNASSIAHANYLELTYLKTLSLYGVQTFFRSSQSILQPSTTYSLLGTDGTEMIWDITDPQNALNQTYTYSNGTMEFGANSSILKEYVILKGTAFPNPSYVGMVPNQNLHDISSSNMPDMIIVAHPMFMAQAQRLANFRTANDGVKIYICTVDQVYNEFASGKSDLTAIRDFTRMVYDRGTPGAQLKYLLLFGAANYDYKNHLGIGGNFVPTYESRNSLDDLQSYNSDDYFGFMDLNEGYWSESPVENNTLNIGVGRIPTKTSLQADIVVNKSINASNPSTTTNGNWENKMTLVADDGDGNLHLNDTEYLANIVGTNNPQMNINKIYMDAYPQESTPGGETATLVFDAINRDIDEGTLIWNYVGHGGNIGLSQEAVVTTASINNWANINHLHFSITATCSFGRFDKPGLICGAENVLYNGSGGSFGNLTSTRTVFASTNATINRAFYDYAFLRNADGSYYNLGDIIKETKNASIQGVYNRNYTMLGDPSMKIRYPKHTMIITTVNGTAVNSIPDTLKALSKVVLEGLVQDYTGVTLTSYTGLAKITIYDKPATIATLGTGGSTSTTFKLQNNIIFDGLATVTNGAYTISFIVPKDISYQYDYGKISLYSELTNGSTDAGGYLTNVVVGGSNPNAPIDRTPPLVKLYLNDASFVSGGITRENPIFYANVSDENGINVSAAGIGHEITLVLSNSSNVIILNKYYTAAQDDYSKGTVRFPLKNLPPGTYTLRFKIWDTYNNSTEETLEFTIESTTSIQLSHVLNYPNPFTTNTTFHFDQNRYGDNLMVQIQVYTVSGKLVKTMDETIFNSPSHISSISWDGKDDYGDNIGRGVYVYKLKIRSLQDGSTTHVFEKLVLLN